MKPLFFLLALICLAAALLLGCSRPTPAPPPLPTATYTVEPSPTSPPTATPDVPYSTLVYNLDGSNERYRSIGRLLGSESCTTFFMHTVDSLSEAARKAPAYVVSNAHCVGASGTDDVLRDVPNPQGFSVIFNYFVDTQETQIGYRVKNIAFASSKGSDLAILELDASVADLMGRNLRPLEVMPGSPAIDDQVEVVGAPVASPKISEEQAYLRRGTCSLAGQADLLEGPRFIRGAYRNGCPDVLPGSSGSPVISLETEEVVGVVAATSVDSAGKTDCYAGRPCELTPAGTSVWEDTTYAVSLQGLALCFDGGGFFDVRGSACPLESAEQPTLDPTYLGAVNPSQPDPEGNLHTGWNILLSGEDFTSYRYKVVRAGEQDCGTEDGYSDPQPVAANPLIAETLPTEEGFYFMCVLGGGLQEDRSETWQDLRFAARALVHIDLTPPAQEPLVWVDKDPSAFQVRFTSMPPELVYYRVKFGPPDRTDCTDPDGYNSAPTGFLTLSAVGAPHKLCVTGYDEAFNPSEPLELRLE